jgi:hypothetical protein
MKRRSQIATDTGWSRELAYMHISTRPIRQEIGYIRNDLFEKQLGGSIRSLA